MKKTIENSDEFKKFTEEYNENINFLNSFSNLIFYNGRIISIFSENHMYSVSTILIDNSIKTLNSIKLCCSIGSFTDANTLLRKLRDDLILYVYILNVVNNRKVFVEEDIKNLKTENQDDFFESFSNLRFNPEFDDNERAVIAWLGNLVLQESGSVKNRLSFENYMKYLKQNGNINKILQDYNLQDYWETLRRRLNNYIHNNGIQFTSHNLIKEFDSQLEIHLKNINIRTSYVVTFFLVLVIMTESTLISSTDMMDYLNCDEEPPEGCQYEIAPFIQNFLDEKVVKIHPELKQFLRDNNGYGMKIN